MNALQLIIAPIGLVFAVVGWWMLRNSRKAADITIEFESKGPLKPPVWHGSETSRRIEAGGYKVVGAWFLFVGTAFFIINLLFGFGVLTPSAN